MTNVVSPPGGGAATVAPFFIYGATNSVRYQQVYEASDFAARIPQGGWVIQIAFQETECWIAGVLPHVQIDLSTTTKSADGLSTVFAENIGANGTVVYDGLLRPLGDCPALFSMAIDLTTPFYFDPSAGNLLLEVHNFVGLTDFQTFRPLLEADTTLGDTVSSVYAGSVDSSAGGASSLGLVTRFTVVPVPEPSFTVLFGLGAVVLGWRIIRQRQRSRFGRQECNEGGGTA